MGGEKQFEASARKLEKAKKDGKVAKAKEISVFVHITICYLSLYFMSYFSNNVLQNYHKVMRGNEWGNSKDLIDFSAEWFQSIWIDLIILLAPIWILTLLSEYLQVGLSCSIKKIVPKLSNLNPLEGFKKVFGERDGLKCPVGLFWYSLEQVIVWVLMISLIVYGVVSTVPKFLEEGLGYYIVPLFIDSIKGFLGNFALFFMCYAMVKYQLSKFRIRKELMMDMEELKKENREDEGDPQLKGQRKSLHQEAALHGNIENIRKAKVLVISE